MARTPKIAATPTEVAAPVSKSKYLNPVNIVLIGLLVIAVAVAGYFYWQYRHSAVATDKKEIDDLVAAIGNVMELPEGEMPTLATVKDKEKLQQQPFFARAENGDKVLIYSGNGRAILYRPSTKKIIEVSSVNANTPTTNQTTQTSPETTTETAPVIIRMAIYNGSGEEGVATALEKQFRTAYPNIAVVTKADASKEYEESIVTDITGKNASVAQAIAETLRGKMGTLPTGEKSPEDADIVVIVGKNR